MSRIMVSRYISCLSIIYPTRGVVIIIDVVRHRKVFFAVTRGFRAMSVIRRRRHTHVITYHDVCVAAPSHGSRSTWWLSVEEINSEITLYDWIVLMLLYPYYTTTYDNKYTVHQSTRLWRFDAAARGRLDENYTVRQMRGITIITIIIVIIIIILLLEIRKHSGNIPIPL